MTELTIAQAAKRVGVTTAAVRDRIRRHGLTVRKTPGFLDVVLEPEILQWIADRKLRRRRHPAALR